MKHVEQLRNLGYTLLPRVFDAEQMRSLGSQLAAALQTDQLPVLRSRGQTYGSRDLIRLLPEVCESPSHPVLSEFIAAVLGPDAGLVRALFFDKPPDRSWSLPWHRDRTIAVQNNETTSSEFRKPTNKAGIPHVEAPQWLLADMLTLRVHLDAMTAENGPLSVIPGSHIVDAAVEIPPVELHTEIGDVLAMRPLLSHSSSLPRVGTNMHRRVIHLELAARAELPDGYQWHTFKPVAPLQIH